MHHRLWCTAGQQTNKQITSKDRATQLLICEKLSLAISRQHTARLLRTVVGTFQAWADFNFSSTWIESHNPCCPLWVWLAHCESVLPVVSLSRLSGSLLPNASSDCPSGFFTFWLILTFVSGAGLQLPTGPKHRWFSCFVLINSYVSNDDDDDDKGRHIINMIIMMRHRWALNKLLSRRGCLPDHRQ